VIAAVVMVAEQQRGVQIPRRLIDLVATGRSMLIRWAARPTNGVREAAGLACAMIVPAQGA